MSLIDFGLARVPGQAADDAAPPRGLDLTTEPEAAAARLRGVAPEPTAAGEQYSLAAMVYALLTGADRQLFAVEREALLEELAAPDVLPFRDHGIEGLPAVEVVVSRALSRAPGGRFDSVAAFRDAFEAAAASDLASRPGAHGRAAIARPSGRFSTTSRRGSYRPATRQSSTEPRRAQLRARRGSPTRSFASPWFARTSAFSRGRTCGPAGQRPAHRCHRPVGFTTARWACTSSRRVSRPLATMPPRFGRLSRHSCPLPAGRRPRRLLGQRRRAARIRDPPRRAASNERGRGSPAARRSG